MKKVDAEKLRQWTETLEKLQRKLPAEVSYSQLESYGEIRHYLATMLKRAEQEESRNGKT